ncbi:DMT family transporter [Salidesulfovibrio brasiliensis]|uniref:DMT family transporter n=1 Tax=Salidesulfovibrio brasiliensis TaxID=221711 RepID=UPI000A69FC8E
MTNRGKAMAFGLSTVLIWSTVASAFKISLRHLTPAQLLLAGCAASIVALFGVLAFQKRLHTLKMSSRELLRAALLGILNPFLYYLILFKAYDLLPAQEAQPLNYTWAVTLSLLSIPLLGQKMTLRQLAAILISYLGVVVISTHGDLLGMRFSDPLGVGLALFSTVIWALYWIFNTNSKCDPVAGLLVNFLAGFPLILAACLLTDGLPDFTGPALLGSATWDSSKWASPSPSGWRP